MAVTIKDLRFSIYLNNEQAKKSAIEMQSQLEKVRNEMKQLSHEGKKDTAAYREKKKVYDEMLKTFEQTKIQAGLVGLSFKELRRLSISMKNDLHRMIPGSEEWKRLSADIKVVDSRIDGLRGSAKRTESSLSKMANGFNKYFAMGASFIAGITGASMAFRRLAEDVAKMDDVYSDVMKTTGMTRDEVLELNEAFKKIDTRTSREELNLLGRDAGKLGISGKKNILDFVDAGNQIRVALGEDLGEDAIKNIGKMVGVFKESSNELQGLDLKGQMLSVGSAVNELGASSTANEKYLVEFAGRLGGVAKQAGISMSSILGFASSLDQDMQAVEMSATALQRFIMSIMSEPAKFAKIAGMEVKQFTELLKTDANQAITTVLRKLNEKGGFQQLLPIFKDMGLDGARAVGVLSSLAGSIDQVEEAQKIANKAMLDGVSITNEYDIKNNNMQAQLDKARKAFKETSLELGESLNPILLTSTRGMTYFIKALVELPKWLKENRFLIITLVSTWITYSVAVNRAVIVSKLADFWNMRLVTSFKALTAAMKKNPWGLIITGVILSLSWLNKYLNKQKEINIEQAEFLSLAEKTKELFGDTKSLEDRAKAMKSLSKTQLEVLQSDLDSQISALEEHDAKIKTMSQKALDEDVELQKLRTKYNEAKTEREKLALLAPIRWREQALLEGLSKEYSANQKSLKQLRDYKSKVDNLLKTKNPKDPAGDPDDSAIKEREKQLDKELAAETLKLKQNYTSREKFEEDLQALTIKYITKKRDLYKKDSAEWIAYETQLEDIRLKNLKDQHETELDSIRNSNKTILESLDIFENEKRQKLQEDYDDGLIDKERYESELAALEIVLAEKRLQNAKTYLDLISQATFDSEEEKKKAVDDASKSVIAAETAVVAANEKALKLKKKQETDHQNEVAQIRKELGLDREILSYKQGLAALKAKLKEAEASEKETADAINEYKMGKIAEYADEAAKLASQVYNAVSGFERAALTKTEIKYQKQIDAARKAGQDTTELEEEKEQELAMVRAKYADAKFVLQIAQIGAETARAAIISYAEGMALGGPILAVALAGATTLYGLSQVALAKSERDAAKAGYKSGGYTGTGYSDDEVAGDVHMNEFVVQAKGVRNPHVRKFLDVFNNAQLNGTIHMLNTTQILERVRTEPVSTGYKSGGYVQDNNGSDNTDLLISVMGRMISVTDRLSKRLDEGIEANAVISGRNGVHEQTQRYLKYIKNASRP
ncbi:MAG: phage tail tape measure protein [Paludibacter sp.]|nr:phage tail tape measure protein [Paludibacter sp.]